jgi:hypothetical protein
MAVTTINIDSQVLTFANLAAFPLVGTVATIYIAENTNFQYYWNGVAYELLTTLQTSGGGGASINYYLNGSINQGTISGVTYYEMNRTPILGLGTNFTLTNTNNYIASFLTDAGDPNQLNIPAGNWNCELYFNVSNNSGTPSFYIELYKYDGVTFTLIASSSTNPEFITNGTQVDLYTTAIPVPQTTLLATDRLAVRVHVNTSGNRTVTLHTEDNNLCQVITTFSTGLTALNGLIAQVQNFATGTSGTDFAISSVTDTHTFNLPTASALNRGALSSADWSTFNGKVNTGLITSSGLTMNTASLLGRGTVGVGAVEEIVIGSGLTLTGTTLSAAGGGITIGTTAIASGTVNRILFEGAGNVVQQDSTFVWNNTDKRLILGTEAVADTNPRLVVVGKNPSGTTILAAFHNSTGTNNALVVRDDGRIGIGTDAPTTPITIGSLSTARTNLNNTGGGVLSSRQDGNHSIQITLDNQTTTGANTTALFGGRAGDSQIAIGTTNESYTGTGTNQYLGNETRSGVIYNKTSSANRSKLKFMLSNTTDATINRFEWLSGTASSGSFNNGFANTPIMTLVGNGNLLIGTTSQGASATKTLVINNGTAPSGNVTDSFQQYSADIVAGNAAPHFRTENGSIIKLYQETTGIAAAAFVANTSLIFNDTATYGGYTMGQVVAALKAQGLLA